MKVVHLARKPLRESTITSNVLTHGAGGLNIGACRLSTSDNLNGGAYAVNPTHRAGQDLWSGSRKSDTNTYKRGGAGHYEQPTGRWPGNLIFQHLDGCEYEGVKRVKGEKRRELTQTPARSWKNTSVAGINRVGHANEDGKETVANWICVEGCPIPVLDNQSGVSISSGGRTANISTTSTIYGGGKGLGQALSSEEVRGDPGFGDSGGASRFFKAVKP